MGRYIYCGDCEPQKRALLEELRRRYPAEEVRLVRGQAKFEMRCEECNRGSDQIRVKICSKVLARSSGSRGGVLSSLRRVLLHCRNTISLLFLCEVPSSRARDGSRPGAYEKVHWQFFLADMHYGQEGLEAAKLLPSAI